MFDSNWVWQLIASPCIHQASLKFWQNMCRGSFVDFTEFQFDVVLPSTALQVDVYNMAARTVVLVSLQLS